jgi:hypothetical protein
MFWPFGIFGMLYQEKSGNPTSVPGPQSDLTGDDQDVAEDGARLDHVGGASGKKILKQS